MGLAKRWAMDMQEEQYEREKAAWIQEKLGEPEADETHEDWDDLSFEYDESHSNENDYEDFFDSLSVDGKSSIGIFLENMNSSKEILETTFPASCEKNLLVMVHAHIVSSVEAYLSSIFIEKVLSSDEYIKLLVETDPEFAKRKFTIKEIFTKQDQLKSDISQYLKDLIFHNLDKIKPMFRSVFSIDFGDTQWLGKAIALRHHCVHRAGYDKDGNKVSITKESILELIEQSISLVDKVDSELIEQTGKKGLFW